LGCDGSIRELVHIRLEDVPLVAIFSLTLPVCVELKGALAGSQAVFGIWMKERRLGLQLGPLSGGTRALMCAVKTKKDPMKNERAPAFCDAPFVVLSPA